jgi:hypothetical protein
MDALHRERHIVVHRKVGEDARDLERIGNAEPHAFVGRKMGDTVSVEADDAAARLDAPPQSG